MLKNFKTNLVFFVTLFFVLQLRILEARKEMKNLRAVDCAQNIKLTTEKCNEEDSEDAKWKWSRLYEYYIKVIVQPECPDEDYLYKWKLTNKDSGGVIKEESGNKNYFLINDYILDTGFFYLHASVSHHSNKENVLATARCLIIIPDEKPEAKIIGGPMRNVKANAKFIVNGITSVNNNFRPSENATLLYDWQCTATPSNEFCPKTREDNYIEVPEEFAIDGTVYEFILTVRVNGLTDTTKQVVSVTSGPIVNIECMKNCRDITNKKLIVYLSAKCDGCSDTVLWTMQTPSGNLKRRLLSSDVEFKFNNPRLIIKKDKLFESDSYTFIATYYLNGKEQGRGMYNVKVSVSPKRGTCEINPNIGYSLTTEFHLTCKNFQHSKQLQYKVFDTDYSEDILLSWGTEPDFKLFLKAVATRPLKIHAIDADGLETIATVPVTVIANATTIDQIEDIIDGSSAEHLSVSKLIDSGDIPKAIQTAHLLSQHMISLKNTSRILDMQAKLINDLNRIDLTSFDTILAVTGALKSVYRDYSRTIANTVNELAKKIAEMQLGLIGEVIDPLKIEERTRKIFEIITAITTKYRSLMQNELQKGGLLFNAPRYFPIMNAEVITEDYPHYDDSKPEDFSEEDINLFIPIVDNMETANLLAGLCYSATLAPGEPEKYHTVSMPGDQSTSFAFFTEYADIFAKKCFGHPSWPSKVLPSKGVDAFGNEIVYGMLTKYSTAPYWWLDDKIFSSSSTLSQSIFTLSNGMNDLSESTELFYTATNGLDFYQESVSMPPSALWTNDVIDAQMSVHRGTVRPGGNVIIVFNNLKDSKLRVSLKYNSRPSYKDVKTYTVISESNNQVKTTFPSNQEKYGDAWLYVAVLPDFDTARAVPSNKTIQYEVGFISAKCLYLDKKSHKWVSDACKLGAKITMKTVHCMCNKQGHLAYQFEPVLYKNDPYPKIPIRLGVYVNFIVIYFICIVFACFCAAICFAPIGVIGLKSNIVRTVYFASDNTIADRYGYLIIIKTGDMIDAGTTSNVAIKLFGTERRCRSHVLNYPDPNKKMLQRGAEDWFVVTTEGQVGDLIQVYIWHDSVGSEPSWYCNWIKIKDLQADDEWFFTVEKWFCVIKGESNYAALTPIDEDQATTSNDHKTFFLYFRIYHTWNLLKGYRGFDLTYVERLTLILSAFYTAMLFTLVLYGFPKLNLYDSFNKTHFVFTWKILLIGILAAVLSFFVHLTFTILFRSKKYNAFRSINHDLVWLGWLAIILTVSISLSILVYYAIWFSYVTGCAFVISTLIALLLSVTVLEGIYIYLKLYIPKEPFMRHKEEINSDFVITEMENQRTELYPNFGNNLLTPYLAEKYRPLTREEWLQKRQKELKRNKIAHQLHDLIMFLLFMFLLFFIVFANKRDLDVYSNVKMKEMMSGYFTKDVFFEEITTMEEFIEYLNKTVALVTQPAKWYLDYNLVDPGVMIDYCTKILGVVKLRQLRVCQDCCNVPDIVEPLNWKCKPEYEFKYSVIGNFKEHWEPYIDNFTDEFTTLSPSGRLDDDENASEEPKNYRLNISVPMFKYIWVYEDEPFPTIGYITIYPGGGYSVGLGRNLYNTYYNIKYLADSGWIDTKSRAVFVEFLTYNPNYNIFNGVKLIFEQSCSGLLAKTYSIYTIRLLFVSYEFELLVTFIFFAFIVMVAVMIYNYIHGMSENCSSFWKDAWNYLDLCILILSVVFIILHIKKYRSIHAYLSNLAQAQHNEIVFYDNLVYIEQTINIVAAILICFTTIRLWKLLRFGKVFRVMEATVSLSSRPLVALIICHFIIIFVYACIGYIVFGSDFEDFRNLEESISTLMLLMLNLHLMFDFDVVQNSYYDFGYYYYISYCLFSFIITVLYIAIITINYDHTKNKYSNQKSYYSVGEYVKDKIKFELEKLKRKLRRTRARGGSQAKVLEEKVRPKDDEQRYEGLVLIASYQLHCMSIIARSLIVNKYKLSDDRLLTSRNTSAIDQVVRIILGRNRKRLKKEMVYVTTDATKKTYIIKESRLLQMEYVVNYIVNETTKENMKQYYFDKPVLEKDKKATETNKEIGEGLSCHAEIECGNKDPINFCCEELKAILDIINNIRIIEL